MIVKIFIIGTIVLSFVTIALVIDTHRIRRKMKDYK